MRTTLFVKVFLGFWLVCVTILGSWMVANQYLDDLPFSEQQPRPDEAPRRLLLRLIYRLQTAPTEDLPAIVEAAGRRQGVRIWLLDRDARDVLGHPVPAAVRDIAGRLGGRHIQAFAPARDMHLVAHVIYREEEGPLRLVLALPPPRHRFLGMLGANPWLRLLLAAMVSGFACYALSRLLTVRLRQVGRASRQLAGGNLQARIDVRPRGGDETDDLARDFNAMAEQLQERIHAQKRLLGDVSHELRSPLARLRVALALALDAPDKRQDYLERMELETQRLEELIDQLLASRRRAITLDTHIDLVALLQRLCTDAGFEGAGEQKSVTLDSGLKEALVASHADLLQKSFDNLLRNALRHTPPGTAVTVRLAAQGDSYQVSIEDRGPGVPEAELARIFDEFYRVDTARTRQDGGYGLGLAIARRAIRQHGGQLQAENTGSGLRLTATLPADT